MPHPAQIVEAVATTSGGFLLVLSVVVPVASVLLAFATGGRRVERIALATMPLGLVIAVAILVAVRQTAGPLGYLLGGWAPPLGVALRADGLSAVMMTITAVVIGAVAAFARADFRTPAGSAEARAPFAFWILLLAIWGALNTIFVGGDLFTLYVALELLTFSAVPLVCLDGRAETLQAALRYLVFALLGSALYLVGTVLLYGVYGTLDVVLLSQRVQAGPATLVAAALMTVGLLAKTAVFPLHLWLPPAHAGAPAAASAVLSALVVKGSFFIVVRLWFDALAGVASFAATQLLAVLGVAAIVFGSVVALRQERLKLLIAYSTLAQIGYLFLMFPLAFGTGSTRIETGGALAGGLLQAISHATAKAAMFMSAGLIYATLGHDRLTGLRGAGRAVPMSIAAFAAAGAALIGVPPSGASLAKQLLLQATAETEQWWWALAIQVGGVLTSSYVLLVLAHAFTPADKAITLRAPVSRISEAAALVLALCSLLLGLGDWQGLLPVSHGTVPTPLDLKALWSALWALAAGAVVVILLRPVAGRLAPASFGRVFVATIGSIQRASLAFGSAIERIDGMLRQWPAAGLALLVTSIMLAMAMAAGR